MEADLSANPAIPAGTGDLTVCVYNHRIEGHIIVAKVNDGGIQSDQFTAHIDGGAGVNFSAVAPSAPQTVAVGNHTVSEDSLPGYTAVGWAYGNYNSETGAKLL